MEQRTLLVTGGAGFIGSNFILQAAALHFRVVNLDALTYAGNVRNVQALEGDSRYEFVHGDIADAALVEKLLREHQPDAVIHFAAETHVDRSILNPESFVQTNVVGTSRLLDVCLRWWRELGAQEAAQFRFLHVSTDEVYGTLGPSDPPFHEATPYQPNSPYAASKAASDHMVRAYFHTYGLPVLTTNCSNNYGPFQFPEKLIPLMIHNALRGEALPVYGDGQNVRDWLYVEDHCQAILEVLARGRVGETYNIGGLSERKNIDVVRELCMTLDELAPSKAPHGRLITFVNDRPGHDRRYAIDCRKLQAELGWQPRESFASGLRKTVEWYLQNASWVEDVTSGAYRQWITANYKDRSPR